MKGREATTGLVEAVCHCMATFLNAVFGGALCLHRGLKGVCEFFSVISMDYHIKLMVCTVFCFCTSVIAHV